jgi:hypothetical protein
VSEIVPFDRFALNRAISDIQHYLAELECIDRTLAYIAERHHVPHAGPGPAYHYLDIPLGSTYPFTRRMGKPGLPFDEAGVQRDLRGIAAAADRWASSNIQSLRDVIRPIVHPSVSTYDQMISSLDQAHRLLSGEVLFDFGALSNNLGDWKGEAAENFADEFYARFPNVRYNQRATLQSLLGALAVMRATVQFSQHSVMNAVTSGREALREQLKHHSEGNPTLSTKDFLTIASIGTSVLALLFGQVPLAAVSLSAIGAGLTLGSAALPDNTPAEQIAGATADDLFRSLFDAVRDIDAFVGREHDLMHSELSQVATDVSSLRAARLLSPPRPHLVDGVDGATFHHLSSSQYR